MSAPDEFCLSRAIQMFSLLLLLLLLLMFNHVRRPMATSAACWIYIQRLYS